MSDVRKQWRFLAFTLATIGSAVAVTLLGADWFFAGFAYGMVVMHIVHVAAAVPADTDTS